MSDNLADLNAWAPRVLEEVRKLPQLVDVSSDQQNKGQQALVEIDRSTASRLGISAQLIDSTLYGAFGQDQVSINYTQLNQYYVVMEFAPPFLQRPETLRDVYVHSVHRRQSTFERVHQIEAINTSLSVNHAGQFPAVTISFNLRFRRGARRCGAGDSKGNCQNRIARRHSWNLSGHGSGIRGLSCQ